MNGTVNNDIAPVNALHVRIKNAKNTRKSCPNAKKYSITIPVNKRLLGPTKKNKRTNFFTIRIHI